MTSPKPPIVENESTPGGLRHDLLDLGQHRARPLEGRPGRELDVDPHDALVLVRDEPRRQRAAEEARAHRHHRDEHDRQHRASNEQPRDADVAVGRPIEPAIEPSEELPERAPHRPVGGLEQHRRERRRERERAEGRQQHRDGDGQGELLVHLAGEAAQERDRDEHGREDEGDADDRRRHLLHGLDGRLPRGQAVLDVVHDRLDHDDGVVDHDADGEHEAEHRQRVDREAQQREEDEGADDARRARSGAG